MRPLTMKFAGGGIVHHLGLQSYKGAVPALAELIANAWDADAEEVHVTIPLGRSISPRDKIVVKDKGDGMLWQDCEEKYLVIGRNRRAAENTLTTPGGRPLMAHKGLGKLAGFGIAKVVEVKTVSKGKLTHFKMSFDDLDALEQGEPYEPKMLADEKPVNLHKGTEIILKELTRSRAINKEQFFNSMSMRFSIYSEKFKVYVNGTRLEKMDVPLEFRFPERGDADVVKIDKDGFGTTKLPGDLTIKWWIGFTPEPIKEKEFHGVSVLARGRVAQDPWDFNLAGGTWGQHGLRYMTGQIIAEFIDDGIPYDSDTILTNRSGVSWERPNNTLLHDWGRKKIRDLLKIWSERRGQKTLEKVKKKNPELIKKINRFQPRERKELNLALRSLAQIPTMKPEKLAKLFDHVIDGYQDKAFIDILQEINELPPEDREKIIEILMEFDVSEAIRVHKLVSSHALVIRTFREMIEAGVPEKPDMHEYIKKYPWLLGLKYQPMDFDRSFQKVLDERFGIKVKGKEGRKRPDVVVIREGTDVIVIEIKRPGESVGTKELTQIKEYVDYLREWLDQTNTEGLIGENIIGDDVDGYLIAYDVKDDALVRREKDRLERDGIKVCKWYDVLTKTEDGYKKYLNIIKRRAPEDDPRIRELERREIV